jgi:anthrone oxygenase-like protein
MLLKLFRFANIFVSGLNAGVAFSHALQAPQKAKLDRKCFVEVQQKLYLKYGSAGSFLEPCALSTALIIAILARERPASALPMFVAAGCVGAEVAVWAKLIDPINQEIFEWNSEYVSAGWPQLRERWHALHRVRAVLTGVAFGASIISLLNDANDTSTSMVPSVHVA